MDKTWALARTNWFLFVSITGLIVCLNFYPSLYILFGAFKLFATIQLVLILCFIWVSLSEASDNLEKSKIYRKKIFLETVLFFSLYSLEWLYYIIII